MAWRERVKNVLRKNKMTIFLLSGVLLGLIMGFIMRAAKENYTSREIMYVGFAGDIFLQMLKAVALPLMISCLISSIGSLDMRLSGRLGCQLILYITLTKLQSGTMAIILALISRPGVGVSATGSGGEALNVSKKITTADNFLDLVRNLFPSNVVEMTLRQYQTVLIKPKNESNADLYSWDVQEGGEMVDGINMLGVVSISIIVGVALGMMGDSGTPLLDLSKCLSKATMVITFWIIWIAPICIAFLIANQLLLMENFGSLMSKLGMYMVVLFTLFTLQCFVVYPLIFFFLVRKNPLNYILNFSEALVTAFATASSNASLPFSIKCMIEKNRVDPRLVEFVMPVGAAINMDGAAMFQCLATIFIAQMHNQELDFGDLVVILLLCSAASLAAAGVPHNSIVTLVIVLDGLGLPLTDVSLLFAIDWLCDRYQTVVNILGDAIGAAILATFNKDLLENVLHEDGEREVEDETKDES